MRIKILLMIELLTLWYGDHCLLTGVMAKIKEQTREFDVDTARLIVRVIFEVESKLCRFFISST